LQSLRIARNKASAVCLRRFFKLLQGVVRHLKALAALLRSNENCGSQARVITRASAIGITPRRLSVAATQKDKIAPCGLDR
jgi:hypothetical protein